MDSHNIESIGKCDKLQFSTNDTSQMEYGRSSNSLVLLTQKFVHLIKQNGGQIDVLEATGILDVQRRRIYDIINVLEGLGIVQKQRSMLRWCLNDDWIQLSKMLCTNSLNTNDNNSKSDLDGFEDDGINFISHDTENLKVTLTTFETSSGDCEILGKTKAVQTDFLEKRSCGVIGVSLDNTTFSLSCYHCTVDVPIWNWEAFIVHVKTEHHALQHFYINTYVESESDEEDCMNERDGKLEVLTLEDVDSDNNENEIQSRTTCTEKVMNSAKKPLAKNNQQIRFGVTNSTLVMDFLETLKHYPILCHMRKIPLKQFKCAINKILTDLNQRWHTNMSEVVMMKSLNRLKAWFRQALDQREEKPDCKLRYEMYFEKCAEFLPIEEYKEQTNTKCNICKKYFPNEQLLHDHKYKVHNIDETRFKCNRCEQIFSTQDDVRTHMQVHKRHYVCEICGKNYPTRALYKSHKLYHEPPKHQCELCSKCFYRPFILMEHMKVHRNERDYVCEECGKTFVRQKQYMLHKKAVHCALYTCQICQKQFSARGCLNKHLGKFHLVLEGSIEQLKAKKMRKTKHTYIVDPVTNKRRLVCELCGKTYSLHDGLRSHSIKVHGFNPLKIIRKNLQTNTKCKFKKSLDYTCDETTIATSTLASSNEHKIDLNNETAEIEYLKRI